MAHHWRSTLDEPDPMRGIGGDEAIYFTGWALSGTAAVITVLLLWYFHV